MISAAVSTPLSAVRALAFGRQAAGLVGVSPCRDPVAVRGLSPWAFLGVG